MGDSELAHQVGTFSGCADDFHIGGILQVVHTRDRSVAWSSSLYCIRSGSQVYGSFLEDFLEVDDEHCFSSTDERSVIDNHPNIIGHATFTRLGS